MFMTSYKTKIVKRIDLLLKVFFLIITYLYLYYEIFYENKINILLYGFNLNNFLVYYIIIVFILMPVNWSIEAVKWKYSVKNIQKVNFLKSFKASFAGVAFGVFTPNRAGEIPGRALFLDNCMLWKSTFVSSVSAISQFIITVVIGLLALPFGVYYVGIDIYWLLFVSFLSLLSVILIIYFYFKVGLLSKLSKWRIVNRFPDFCKHIEIFKSFSNIMLLNILLLSLLRYLIFAFQFLLIIYAFNINMSFFQSIIFVGVYYLIITSIPTIALSEIGVRGTVGVFLLNYLQLNDTVIQLNMLLASTLLWFINIVIPAIIGTFFIPEIKFIRFLRK